MKKLIFLLLAAISFSTATLASASPDASERILKLFRSEFPKIEKPVFYDYGDSYMVYFKENDSSSGRVYYNLDGEMIKTIKYYSADGLDPFIKAKVNRKYKGKKIFGVTEITTNTDHSYRIVLEDDKKWYTVDADDTGSMSLEQKLKKA